MNKLDPKELAEIRESQKVVCRCKNSICRACDEDVINACREYINGGIGVL